MYSLNENQSIKDLQPNSPSNFKDALCIDIQGENGENRQMMLLFNAENNHFGFGKNTSQPFCKTEKLNIELIGILKADPTIKKIKSRHIFTKKGKLQKFGAWKVEK